MKYIDNMSQVTIEQEELNFNRDGQQIGKDQKNQKTYAKMVAKNGLTSYYICIHRNNLYNPSSISESRERYQETQLKKVQKDVFDFYMMFLSTKKSIYMTKAQRLFLNGN